MIMQLYAFVCSLYAHVCFPLLYIYQGDLAIEGQNQPPHLTLSLLSNLLVGLYPLPAYKLLGASTNRLEAI